MSILSKILIKASSNSFIQNLLETNVQLSQFFLGIGAGGGVAFSGEKSIAKVLKERYKPPYCIFDVGSNKGQFLQLLLDGIPEDAMTVHCFEPGRDAFGDLKNAYGPKKGIVLNNFAIGKEAGEAVLHYDSPGSEMASLSKRRLDHIGKGFDQSENVRVETIDGYCIKNHLDHIHLLKLDVEGHELDALEGARRMVKSKAIDIVTFEFGGCDIDTRVFFRDFWYFFREFDMNIFRITPSGYWHRIKLYKEDFEQFRTSNYAALR